MPSPYVTEVTIKTKRLNTRGVIEARLPELDIGEVKVETTSHSSLRTIFTDQIVEWKGFKYDVASFHNSWKLKSCFSRTEKLYDGNPYHLSNTWETVKVGDEIDFDLRGDNIPQDRSKR
jgi:hypothetical protein